MVAQAPSLATPREFLIGVAPGERIPLLEAYQRLQKLLDLAKENHKVAALPINADATLIGKRWTAVTELAERILEETVGRDGWFRCTPAEGSKALLHRFAVAGAAVR